MVGNHFGFWVLGIEFLSNQPNPVGARAKKGNKIPNARTISLHAFTVMILFLGERKAFLR